MALSFYSASPTFQSFQWASTPSCSWNIFLQGTGHVFLFCFVFSAKGLILPFYVNRGQERAPLYSLTAAAAAKLLQSYPTLCDPIDGSPPGSSVPGILQARILEWVAISFSNAWKWKVKVKALSHVWLFETLWTVAYQAPPSMGFSRQEYWSGLPLPSPGQIWAKQVAVVVVHELICHPFIFFVKIPM